MRATDLLAHINAKRRTPRPGRVIQHLRWLPVYLSPESQPDFHASPMYREAYKNDPEGHAAWEHEAQIMNFLQDELPPPGGITADSEPNKSESDEIPDGSGVTFDRS